MPTILEGELAIEDIGLFDGGVISWDHTMYAPLIQPFSFFLSLPSRPLLM